MKPAVQKVLTKRECVLKELDCNLKEWMLICNSKDDTLGTKDTKNALVVVTLSIIFLLSQIFAET